MLSQVKLYSAIISILTLIFLCGCTDAFNAEGVIPDEATAQNEIILNVLLSRNEAEYDNLPSDEFKQIENYEGLFKKIVELLPTQDEANPKLVYAEIRKNDEKENPFPIYYTVYELKKGEKFKLLEIATQKDKSCCPLRHIQLKNYNVSPSMHNNFTWRDKGAKHFVFIAAMICSLLVILFSLVALVRDKQQQKKILWFIFIMFGFWGASMNWTSGEIMNSFISYTKGSGKVNIKFLDLTFLGAGFQRSGIFQPWIMDVGIPLGAMVYWFRRKTRAKRTAKTFEA